MALQTLTTTDTTTAQDPPPPTGTPSGNGENAFGPSGTTPLVPAFLVTGALLVLILSMLAWRRVTYSRRLRVQQHRLGNIVDVGMGWDGMGAEFVTVHMGLGSSTVIPSGKISLGERPKIWDIYTGAVGRLHFNSSWESVIPVSASFLPSASPISNVPAESPASSSPLSFLRHTNARTEAESTPKGPRTNSKRRKGSSRSGHLRVAVLVSLPSLNSPPYTSLSSQSSTGDGNSEKSISPHGDVDTPGRYTNLHLGVSDVPWTKEFDDLS